MTNTLPSRTSGAKLSKIEKGQVIELIVSCLLQNYRRSEVLAKCKKFNLSDRMIDKYIAKCHEMIATRPLESIERAKRIELTRIEEKQREAEHTRDWTDLERLKLRLLGLDDATVNINHNKVALEDDKLLEIVSEQ